MNEINTSNLYNDMNFFDLIIHSVNKSEVIKKDTNALNRVLKSLRKDLIKSYCKIMLIFDGYDNDQREIYEIREIRDYVRKLFDENNDLFYFITKMGSLNKVILACISDFQQIKTIGREDVIVGYEVSKEVKGKILNALSMYPAKNVKELISYLFN